MSKRQRIEYLLVTLAVFVSAATLFGYAALLSSPIEDAEMALMVEQGELKPFLSWWQYAFFAGFTFSSFASALMLSVRFFAKRRLWFKILAAFFWLFTMWLCLAVGWFVSVPYWIYNLVRIIIDKPPQRTDDAEVYELPDGNQREPHQ